MLAKIISCRAKSGCESRRTIKPRKTAGISRFLSLPLAAAIVLTLCSACSKKAGGKAGAIAEKTDKQAETKDESPFARRIAEDREKGFAFSEDGKTLLRAPQNITECDIPDGVAGIGDNAFLAHNNLRRVTIPSSVTSIGEGAFWGCTSLTSVTIPSSVTSIGEGAFDDCPCEGQVKRDYPHLFK